jgi:hypothetical protein
MRRAILALTVGGVLLTAACGTERSPAASSPAVTGKSVAAGQPAAAQPALAQSKALCEALGQVYSENMGPFAETLSKMIADRHAPGGGKAASEPAQQTLSAFAKAIRGATQGSADPKVRADGKQTADRLQATSTDEKFFAKVQSAKDVNTVLGPTLKEWLAPVTHHCS